jgi:hypothetical protein
MMTFPALPFAGTLIASPKSMIGRNDPCPCGSGMKYKRCCGLDPAAARPGPADPHEQPPTHIEVPASATEATNGPDDAFNRVVEFGLNNEYAALGDLSEAESSLLVHLELYAWLDNQERMADAYASLGSVYRKLGDLEPAEAMFQEALKLDEALGRQAGMAADCGNLGLVHQMRGHPARAASMYEKSMALFRQVGSTRKAETLQDLLERLAVSGAPSWTRVPN